MAITWKSLNEGSYFVVINGHCQYFNTPDVNDVVDYLPQDTMFFPSEVSSGSDDGFTWLKFTLDDTLYYTVYLKDRMRLVTNSWVNYRSEGIDVARYQGNVDWAQVKAAGYEFALIRVVSTESSIYIDPYFEQNVVNAKAAGLKVGAYIFTYAKSEATLDAEIEMAFKVLVKYKYEYPIFLDFEADYIRDNGKAKNTQLCRYGFNKLLAGGFYPGLYTAHLWSTTYIDAAALSDYPLWLAHYTTQTPSTLNYGIWQYGGLTVPGVVSGACDVNHGYIDYQPYIAWNGLNGLSSESQIIPVTTVSLSQTEVKLKVSETAVLAASILPDNATDKSIVWKSSNAQVALVSAGTVTAKSVGTAVITASAANGVSSSCTVTVVKNPSPQIRDAVDIDMRLCPCTDTLEQWEKYDPVPLLNELCVVDGIGIKIGDGIHQFSELSYLVESIRPITNEQIDSLFID